MLYNVVLISGVQQSESTICIHISPTYWTSPLPCPRPSHPSRSSQSTRLSSLHYTVGSHYLSVLHMVSVYMSILISQFIPPHLSPPVSKCPFPTSHVFSLHLHLYFCPSLGSSVPSFYIPHTAFNT